MARCQRVDAGMLVESDLADQVLQSEKPVSLASAMVAGSVVRIEVVVSRPRMGRVPEHGCQNYFGIG